MMAIDGLQKMLSFLSILRSQGLHYRIERQAPDALMVTVSRNDVCIEVDIRPDEVSFSYFENAISGTLSDNVLRDLIEQHRSD